VSFRQHVARRYWRLLDPLEIDDAALRTHSVEDGFAGHFTFQEPAEHLQEVISSDQGNSALSRVLYHVVREDRGIGSPSLTEWEISPRVTELRLPFRRGSPQ
jgi:hypothetical protein